MSDLSDGIHSIHSSWRTAFALAQANSALWKPHWPHGELAVIDEMVTTLDQLIGRERAPSGFGPGFQVARSLVAGALPGLQSTVAQLAAGQFNYLPAFVGQIQDALSKVHSVIMFSGKDYQGDLYADLSTELAQSISLLQTAQAELAEKQGNLSSVEALAKAVKDSAASSTEAAVEIAGAKESAGKNLAEIQVQKGAAEKGAEAIAATHKQMELATTEAEKLLTQTMIDVQDELEKATTATGEATDAAKKSGEALAELMKATEQQSALIASILPKGASAGLAAAFSFRVGQLNWARWIWMIVFVASVCGLASLTIAIPMPDPKNLAEFWPVLGWRLTKAAPLVWITWVSIVQYGNTIRLQEDYAFKEATSKAFQGYRDHMDHLRKVSDEEGNNALNLLSARTIEILARDPLRLYGKAEKDSSPTNSLLAQAVEFFKGKTLPKGTGDG